MRSLYVPRVAWIFDLYFGYHRERDVRASPVFQGSDLVFTTDGGHGREFEAAGVHHRLLRQGIDEDEIYLTLTKPSGIGFIGSLHSPYRRELSRRLTMRYGSRYRVYGADGGIRHDDLNRLVASLSVVVGDSVASPHYWSNRVYEVAGRGGVLIHPRTEGLDQELTPGREYVPYDRADWDGLMRTIDGLLEDPEKCRRIRLAAMRRIRREHTYRHRVSELLRVIREEGIL